MNYNKIVTLKNNKKCIIKNASEKEAQGVLDVFNATRFQTDFLLTYPDETNFTIEQEKEFLLHKEKSKNEIQLCAIVDDKIVATASVDALGNNFKIKHRAELGIAVNKTFWRMGIGKELAIACIECAKMAGYLQLELSVVSGNLPAVSLYKKIGFVEYGRNPKGFNSRKTGWQELVLMRLELN